MPKWIRDTPMETLKLLFLQDLGEKVSGVVVRTDEDEAHLLESDKLTHLKVASFDVPRELAGGTTKTQPMRSRIVRSGFDWHRMEQ